MTTALDVFGVHCIGGIVGAIGTGIVADPALGGQGWIDYTAPVAVAGEYDMAGAGHDADQGGRHHGRVDRRRLARCCSWRSSTPSGCVRAPKSRPKASTSTSTASAPTTTDRDRGAPVPARRRPNDVPPAERLGRCGDAPALFFVPPLRPEQVQEKHACNKISVDGWEGIAGPVHCAFGRRADANQERTNDEHPSRAPHARHPCRVFADRDSDCLAQPARAQEAAAAGTDR